MDDSPLFSALSGTLLQLDEALLQPLTNSLAIDATIRRFTFSFELFWKWLKKLLLEKEGVDVPSPKQVLQKAYSMGWLENEQTWLLMLDARNLTSHTYKEEMANEIYHKIEKFYPELKKAFVSLKKRFKIQ